MTPILPTTAEKKPSGKGLFNRFKKMKRKNPSPSPPSQPNETDNKPSKLPFLRRLTLRKNKDPMEDNQLPIPATIPSKKQTHNDGHNNHHTALSNARGRLKAVVKAISHRPTPNDNKLPPDGPQRERNFSSSTTVELGFAGSAPPVLSQLFPFGNRQRKRHLHLFFAPRVYQHSILSICLFSFSLIFKRV